jgi:hypothetical protein
MRKNTFRKVCAIMQVFAVHQPFLDGQGFLAEAHIWAIKLAASLWNLVEVFLWGGRRQKLGESCL